MEIWKDIKGYERKYQVSNLGRIKSLKRRYRKTERILTKHKHYKNYDLVSLSKDGKIKTYTVHRLVALAFIPNPENKLEINHKISIRDDNRVDNLEFCTAKENSEHGYKYGFRTNNHSKKPIRIWNKDEEYYFNSVNEATEFIGCGCSQVSGVLNKRRKTVYGWKTEYQKEE
mgnify:CR=1 FL=1